MTGEEMYNIRVGLGLSPAQFGNAIGYNGTRNTVIVSIKQYESNERPIPKWIATTVRALDCDGLLVFIDTYVGPDDRAEFVRRLSQHLTGQL